MSRRYAPSSIVVLALLGASPAVAAGPVPAPTVLGHWRLQGDPGDSSSNAWHARPHGVGWHAQGGAELDGRSAWLEVPASPVWRLGTNDFTVALWLRLDEVLDDSEFEYRRAWSMAVYRGRLFCGTLPSGHVRALEAGVAVSHDVALAPGWRHVATMRAGDRLKLFVDGVCVARSPPFDAARFNLAPEGPLRIGLGEHDYFHGTLRDVRWFGRALSEGEVEALLREAF